MDPGASAHCGLPVPSSGLLARGAGSGLGSSSTHAASLGLSLLIYKMGRAALHPGNSGRIKRYCAQKPCGANDNAVKRMAFRPQDSEGGVCVTTALEMLVDQVPGTVVLQAWSPALQRQHPLL